MSNFIIAIGHTASGNKGCGIVAQLDESICTREIGALLEIFLKETGHNVNLIRVDKGNSYNYEDCYRRADVANSVAKSSKVDLYVEIHINGGGGSGPEVCVSGKSPLANQYAVKVSGSLANSLNLKNRGVKTQNLIVLNKTVMPAILVECLFADSKDAEVYDPKIIAKAILNGLDTTENYNSESWKLGWNKNNIGWWYCTSLEDKFYYTSKNGWKEINGEWYIFDSNGYALENSWYYDKSNRFWYYLDFQCKMVKGDKNKPKWMWIDSECYSFNESGQMYSGCITPDGWKVDKYGAWIK